MLIPGVPDERTAGGREVHAVAVSEGGMNDNGAYGHLIEIVNGTYNLFECYSKNPRTHYSRISRQRV